MTELQTIFYKLIPFIECLCALVAVSQFNKLKNSYWKWFVIYLVFIALAELFSAFILKYIPEMRKYFFNYFIIPIEFLFFFWLYAKKSLNNNRLFFTAVIIYLSSLLFFILGYDKIRIIGSISYTIGNLLLTIMLFLEFLKQIKSDEILNFRTNKMFYINFGILFLYVGTVPLFALDKYLFENDKILWNYYFTYFLFSVNIMYLLFTASFIWGKHKP